jgi:o-succinylbenzoate synthase
MPSLITYKKHTLQFKFDAGTSRGVLKTKDSWFVRIVDEEGRQGIGEAGPLKGLSIDDRPDFEEQLEKLLLDLAMQPLPTKYEEVEEFVQSHIPEAFPSIIFAVETALYDLLNGGQRIIYDTPFARSERAIPINGLIWMGTPEFMQQQIEEKLAAGFNCIKMKIGAIDFEEEYRLLKMLRKRFPADQLTLRVDANGAFTTSDALQRLVLLHELEIHSIEQPIMAGQNREMHQLCRFSPLPIALDEELIGIPSANKASLLDSIMPQFIILKPTLHGGIGGCRAWIRLAEERQIGWWMTSALESNIGLNAIAQFTDTYQPHLPQGLGTGQLYHNNIPSPLQVAGGELTYKRNGVWMVPDLD